MLGYGRRDQDRHRALLSTARQEAERSGLLVVPARIALATAKDHVHSPQEEMPFKAACERALEVATLRRAKMIMLLPE